MLFLLKEYNKRRCEFYRPTAVCNCVDVPLVMSTSVSAHAKIPPSQLPYSALTQVELQGNTSEGCRTCCQVIYKPVYPLRWQAKHAWQSNIMACSSAALLCQARSNSNAAASTHVITIEFTVKGSLQSQCLRRHAALLCHLPAVLMRGKARMPACHSNTQSTHTMHHDHQQPLTCMQPLTCCLRHACSLQAAQPHKRPCNMIKSSTIIAVADESK